MKRVEINTIQEAKRILPMLAMIQVGLALRHGYTVEVVDERRGIEYIFRPDCADGSEEYV